ncbi:MAG: N-acetyltransferase [Sedimentisphaerales bacterium]|nr:N-acetyltransferase [Sedimentisphaerales bacterium]
MIRTARLDDVPVIRELINHYAEQGKMLFRSQSDIYESLRDFKLYELDGVVVGCCGLRIIWADLAEIISLSVNENYQGRGIGRALVQACLEEARQLHLPRVFTLTLERAFFEKSGFSVVPMKTLPLKVWSDCVRCPKQDCCDEIAMIKEISAD